MVRVSVRIVLPNIWCYPNGVSSLGRVNVGIAERDVENQDKSVW